MKACIKVLVEFCCEFLSSLSCLQLTLKTTVQEKVISAAMNRAVRASSVASRAAATLPDAWLMRKRVQEVARWFSPPAKHPCLHGQGGLLLKMPSTREPGRQPRRQPRRQASRRARRLLRRLLTKSQLCSLTVLSMDV